MKRKIIIFTAIFLFLFTLFSTAQKKPVVWQEKCVGCSDCVSYCPVKAISIIHGKARIDQQKCIDCKLCLTTCTYKAIK
jgi:Fe-S-cluster-containing hydrogenase component 2